VVVADAAAAVAEADHVVIGVPSTPETRNLVDADLLAGSRSGIHLVNVSRGSVVDQDALRSALDSGQVGLASLDVCDPEPLPEGHWLYTHPSVRLSPHISWCSPNSFDQMGANFAANLGRWLDGRPLEDVVDRDVGY
jgi:phosphoglycerate dehydrogenase-like enzyme